MTFALNVTPTVERNGIRPRVGLPVIPEVHMARYHGIGAYRVVYHVIRHEKLGLPPGPRGRERYRVAYALADQGSQDRGEGGGLGEGGVDGYHRSGSGVRARLL